MKQEISEQLKYRNGDHICVNDLVHISFGGSSSTAAVVSRKSHSYVLNFLGLSNTWRWNRTEELMLNNKDLSAEYTYGNTLIHRVIKIARDQLMEEEKERYDKLIKYLDNESSTNNT